MKPKTRWLTLGVATMLSLATTASADTVLDFRTVFPNSGTINGALYNTTVQQPTGSGVIHSFVRISDNDDQVEGYNTDGRPLQFDENNSGTFTRSLNVDWLQSTVINGVSYYQFLLDINQNNSQIPDMYLSLNELQVFLGNAPDLLNATADSDGLLSFGTNASLVYDMDGADDANAATSSRIDLNYDWNSGSGSGDMYAYIPTALFTGPNKWVYLYSQFGAEPFPNNDGYEEWAAVVGPNTVPVPIPLAAWGGMALCGFVGASKLRRRQQVD